MNAWFRFYNAAIRDPKVLRLNDSDFRLWVSLLSVASDNGGLIPPLSDLKLLLNRRLDHLSAGIKRLISVGFIDKLRAGYAPHNWAKYQYKSDGSTDRVKRFRQRSRNGAETANETGPESESESESDPPTPRRRGAGPGPDIPVLALAEEVCTKAGVKCGAAAIEHVRRWRADGIPEATIRSVVFSMAGKVRGSTLSLKRFDGPIRREHAEHPAPVKANGVEYVPQTRDELERALACAEANGWPDQAERWRTNLAELTQVAGTL